MFWNHQTLASNSPHHLALNAKGYARRHLTGVSRRGRGSPQGIALVGLRLLQVLGLLITYISSAPDHC